MEKTIAVLGCSGSVGVQALDVAKNQNIKVDALSGGKNVSLVEEQVRQFKPRFCAMASEEMAVELRARVKDTNTKILSGEMGILEIVNKTSADTIVNSIVGLAGLRPTLEIVGLGKRIAIANKESLVAAGEIVKKIARQTGAEILPVDSEHSAIFQCLKAGEQKEVKKILLTASGGPFYGYTPEMLRGVTKAQALNHPTWKMGAKITTDSASLMNKGLEVIEAVRLFDVKPSQIEVVVHRESIIHSAVEYIDNAVIAQLGVPDMRACVQYALSYPNRCEAVVNELDLFSVGSLTFKKPDRKTFKLLDLAYKSVEIGGLLPAVLSSANEAAVELFLSEKIKFYEIAELCEKVMQDFENKIDFTTEDVFTADKTAREAVYSVV